MRVLDRLITRLKQAGQALDSPPRPPWVDEVLDALRRQARSALKASAGMEAALGQSAAELKALRAEVRKLAQLSAERATSADRPDFDPLFDALDALEQAVDVTREPHQQAGLRRVMQRIEHFCALAGYRRVCGHGQAPDPGLMRVVGSEPVPGMAAGQVSRTVRAAIVRGQTLVREGEVVVVAPDVIVAAKEDAHEQLGD